MINGTLGGPNAAIPTVDTSFALGEDLSNGVTSGATGTVVHVHTTTHSENRSAENVIAESRTGDPVGIPAGGLFTGAEEIKTDAQQQVYGGTAGEAFDPCYHQACDDIENISERGLNQMSDAVAHAVNYYAYSLKFIPRPTDAPKAKHKKATRTKYLGSSLRK